LSKVKHSRENSNLSLKGSEIGGKKACRILFIAMRAFFSYDNRSNSKGAIMKSFRKELWFQTPSRRAFVNITPQVQQCLQESGIQEGLVLVNAMHITASVFINDDEAGLHQDFEAWLEQLAPYAPVAPYGHNRGEDNADAHLKRQIMGREVVVAITAGRLDFGPWEQIFYGEFDGGRKKRVLVKLIGE
jgi:secondary thiamine-phosphate synthase enzyme